MTACGNLGAAGGSNSRDAWAGIRDRTLALTAGPNVGTGNSQPTSTCSGTGAGSKDDIHSKAMTLIETTPCKEETTPPPRKVPKRRRAPTPSTGGDSQGPEFDERLGHECRMMTCRHRITGKKHKFHWEIPDIVEMELAPLVGTVCVWGGGVRVGFNPTPKIVETLMCINAFAIQAAGAYGV